jgi:hypothetical protein
VRSAAFAAEGAMLELMPFYCLAGIAKCLAGIAKPIVRLAKFRSYTRWNLSQAEMPTNSLRIAANRVKHVSCRCRKEISGRKPRAHLPAKSVEKRR